MRTRRQTTPSHAAATLGARNSPSDGVPAIVSGAGPTVLAFTDTTDGLMARCPDGWTALQLDVDSHGAVGW